MPRQRLIALLIAVWGMYRCLSPQYITPIVDLCEIAGTSLSMEGPTHKAPTERFRRKLYKPTDRLLDQNIHTPTFSVGSITYVLVSFTYNDAHVSVFSPRRLASPRAPPLG